MLFIIGVMWVDKTVMPYRTLTSIAPSLWLYNTRAGSFHSPSPCLSFHAKICAL